MSERFVLYLQCSCVIMSAIILARMDKKPRNWDERLESIFWLTIMLTSMWGIVVALY